MKPLVLIDPAMYSHRGVPSPNLGDQIISRAVHRELFKLFGVGTKIVCTPSHAYPRPALVPHLRAARHVIVGGSNLLSFHPVRPTSWKIGPVGHYAYRSLVLLGAGWGSYQIHAGVYSRWVAQRILSSESLHSVRDAYTERRVREDLRLPNVINTACPTMWELTPGALADIPVRKAESCLFTFTDYSQDPARDARVLQLLQQAYSGNLTFWPQGTRDLGYLQALGYTGRVLDRSLVALLEFLKRATSLDYVGTRLHAGILCLEHGVRSLVITVDNRATEIARDTNLPIMERNDFPKLSRWLEGETDHRIIVPFDRVERWRSSVLGQVAGLMSNT